MLLEALQKNRSLRTHSYMDAWEGPIQSSTRLREPVWSMKRWSHSPLIYGVLDLIWVV